MSASNAFVWLARILRTQGRKGEVFAEILTDFPEKFSERRQLWLVREPAANSSPSTEPLRSLELIDHWLHKGGIVLHFAGIDSISAAETLAGLGVAIPLAERVPLPSDEAYIADMIGCTLFDVSGTEPVPIGPIDDVDRTAGPAPLLIVRGPSGEILIPFAKSYLRLLDLEGRRIEMALPEGLVTLNRSE
ncbi:MAG TPA: ribosome maturation factor RimM [Terracidiphilus sp.]|jgi:16S rRNA processing protein RimM|nr:ribosome maturation factor RimM [Terracidiphilus sp.]